MSTTGGSRTPAQGSNTHDVSDSSAKVAKPDVYYGQRDKLEDWLIQLELYFSLQGKGLPNNRRVIFAASYMRGQAQKWIKPFLKRYFEEPDGEDNLDIKKWLENFRRFTIEVRRVFGPSNEEQVAVRIIQHMTQKKSAAEYSTQFQQYAAQTDWDDNALMSMYRRGLKDTVKDELMRTGAVIKDMESLMAQAIEIDDKLYERTLERNYDKGGNFKPNYHKFRPHFVKKEPYDPYGLMPMELDSFQKKREFKGKKQQKGKKAVTCYGCGKPGHIARNCRSKGMVSRPQLNVLERVPSKEKGPEEGFQLPTLQRQDASSKGLVSELIKRRIREIDEVIDSIWDQADESDPEQEQGSPDKEEPGDLNDTGSPDNSDTWTNASEEIREATQNPITTSKPKTEVTTRYRDYSYDSLHPKHRLMHWTACADEKCHWHKEFWVDNRPLRSPNCGTNKWIECIDDACHWHLASKRVFVSATSTKMTANECSQEDWYFCVTLKCERHRASKEQHGFLQPRQTGKA